MMTTNYAAQLAKLDFYADWSSIPDFHTEIDPFDYRGRLGVYKLMMDALNVKGAFGAFNEKNVFWGYIFQVAWQWRSGRLTLPNTEPGRIHPHSMWGYANYSLSVIPMIAAINVGIIKPLAIRPPYEHGVIDYARGGGGEPYVVPDEFSMALPAWTHFFRTALERRPGDDLEALRFALWTAHKKSLEGAAITIAERGGHYHTSTELDFLAGWSRMVDFLGAAAWRTDLDFMLEHGLGVLPERTLTADDRAGRIRNLSPLVNANLVNIMGLAHQSKARFGWNLFLWKRAMRSRQARDEVLTMLNATFNPTPQNRRARMRLFRYMLSP